MSYCIMWHSEGIVSASQSNIILSLRIKFNQPPLSQRHGTYRIRPCRILHRLRARSRVVPSVWRSERQKFVVPQSELMALEERLKHLDGAANDRNKGVDT